MDKLGILGAGNMAEAIVRGLLRAGRFAPDSIVVSDPSQQRREFFQSQLKVISVADNASAARDAGIVLISVKPQQMAAALAGVGSAAKDNATFVSIAAGITTASIEKSLGEDRPRRVVRAMPNTPMLVGAGAAAICPGRHATAADLAAARRLFEPAGVVIETTEDKLNAVTAVSGSGPAYFFYLTERLIAAGVELGLSPSDAHRLAVQTALGAGRMLAESGKEPAELRRNVTSPGGTTEAAIAQLDQSGWPAATVEAVKAAARRSAELSR